MNFTSLLATQYRHPSTPAPSFSPLRDLCISAVNLPPFVPFSFLLSFACSLSCHPACPESRREPPCGEACLPQAGICFFQLSAPIGTVTINLVPPPSRTGLSHVIAPPISAMRRATIARPSPVPLAFVVKNG